MRSLWGKQHGLERSYPLVAHLVDTSVAVEYLWDEWLPEGLVDSLSSLTSATPEQVRSWASGAAALHDLGKADPGFQLKSPDERDHPDRESLAQWDGRDLPHPIVGGCAMLAFDSQGRSSTGFADILAGHHGRFAAPGEVAARLGASGGASWVHVREDATRWMLPNGIPDLPGVPVSALLPLTGLVILADWLVSDERFVSSRLESARALLREGSDARVVVETLRAGAKPAVGQRAHALGLTRMRMRRGSGFEEVFGRVPRPLQRDLGDCLPELITGPGLLIVMAPTGEGKTEAALRSAQLLGAASGREGFFFALPTQATTDAMFARVTDFLSYAVDDDGTAVVALLHGMAAFNPQLAAMPLTTDGAFLDELVEQTAEPRVSPWLRGSKRGPLASVGVGTIDQVLAAALRGRHNAVRWLGLSGKTLIVDEAHALDSYMQVLLATAVQWYAALDTPVVALSATLPTQVVNDLLSAYAQGYRTNHPDTVMPDVLHAVPFPGWIHFDGRTGTVTTGVVSASMPRTIAVQVRTGRAGSQHGLAVNALEPILSGADGCAVVVCNTVNEAQDMFETLRERLVSEQECELFLLHSRFPAWQRQEITSRVLEAFGPPGPDVRRPRRAILVGTQVVEQSLDLDFDLQITWLAPMGMLLQRAGRCWRHDRRTADGLPDRPAWILEPTVVVLAAAAAGQLDGHLLPDRFPYQEADLRAAWNVLRDHPQRSGSMLRIDIPGDGPGGVQAMVDAATREWIAAPDPSDAGDVDRWMADLNASVAKGARDQVMQVQAGLRAIPRPETVDHPYLLTSPVDADDALALLGTRWGVSSTRVLPVWSHEGTWFLDAQLTVALPMDDLPGVEDVRRVILHSIPVPSSRWVDDYSARAPHRPASWKRSPHLADLLLLDLSAPVLAAGRRVHLHPVLGLIAREEKP